jgi:hypothetical protein
LTTGKCGRRISVCKMHVAFKMNSFIHQWLNSLLLGPGSCFSFVTLYTVGRTHTWDQPVVRPLLTHRTELTQNKCTQTSLPRVGFELTTPMFERAKTVLALDRAATVISFKISYAYDYIIKLGSKQPEVIQNHLNPNLPATGQGEAI